MDTILPKFQPDRIDQILDKRDDISVRWHRQHHGHNVIRESFTVLHCVNCQDSLLEEEE